jgi:hypothetical protein
LVGGKNLGESLKRGLDDGTKKSLRVFQKHLSFPNKLYLSEACFLNYHVNFKK